MFSTASSKITIFSDGHADSDKNLTTATVAARDKLEISLEVKKAESILFWRFRVQDYDIAFQVVNPEGKNLVAWNRIETPDKQFHEDNVLCSNVGKYTLIFDNSYSLTRPKILSYSVSVEKQPENPENLEK